MVQPSCSFQKFKYIPTNYFTLKIRYIPTMQPSQLTSRYLTKKKHMPNMVDDSTKEIDRKGNTMVFSLKTSD